MQEFDIEIRDKKGSENVAADHLSRLEEAEMVHNGNKEINDNFPDELLFAIATLEFKEPWFADLANYLASGDLKEGLSTQDKRKFFADLKHYY